MSILDEEDGPLVFERSCKLGLEGIVSKWRDSPYSFRALPGTVRVRTMIKISAILVLLAALVTVGTADPIAPGAIEVIDGDTIRAHGRTVRLVGFDAPESGLRARCESERALAAKATSRLRQLVGRFHGSNHMPTKTGPSGCSCEMPVNEQAMMAADMIGFMESVV
jgi:hypothetical protein